MKFLRQEAGIFDSNIIEPWSDWDEATTYNIEASDPGPLTDTSVVKYGNYFYRTIMDGNVGFIPTEHLGTRWIQWQVSNKHAMFDLRATTKTVSETGGNIVVQFSKGLKDTLGIGYYTANRLRIDNLAGGVLNAAGNVNDYVLDFDGYFKMVTAVGTVTTTQSVSFNVWNSSDTYEINESGNATSVSNSVVDVNGLYYKSLQGTNIGHSPYQGANIGVWWELLLQDTNVVDWSSASTYDISLLPTDSVDTTDVVLYNGLHYRSLQSGNLNNLPDAGGSVWWEEVACISHAENSDGTFSVITSTQTLRHSVNDEVYDYYSYIYAPYVMNTNRGRLFYLPHNGSNVRVTLFKDGVLDYAECGFLVASEATSMGKTLFGIDFSFTSYSEKTTDKFGVLTINKRGIQELIDFETIINSSTLTYTKRKIKDIYDDIVLFVLDESLDSVHENIMTLGTISNVSTVLSNPVNTTIAWSIYETI